MGKEKAKAKEGRAEQEAGTGAGGKKVVDPKFWSLESLFHPVVDVLNHTVRFSTQKEREENKKGKRKRITPNLP